MIERRQTAADRGEGVGLIGTLMGVMMVVGVMALAAALAVYVTMVYPYNDQTAPISAALALLGCFALATGFAYWVIRWTAWAFGRIFLRRS